MSEELMKLTPNEIALLEKNNIIPKGCSPEQVQFFAEVCKRKKLDPFLKQIHMVERNQMLKVNGYHLTLFKLV